MSNSEQPESERYYLTHQRIMGLGLLFAVGMTVYVLLDLFGGPTTADGGWIIIGVYFVGIVIVRLATLQGRRLRLRDPQFQAVARDEWVSTNRGRAAQAAFMVMLFAQLPLMKLMAEVPVERAAEAMGGLSVLLGLAAFFGSYLYVSRQERDG